MTVYLDNAATTKPCEEAIEAVVEAMKNNYGNPSSLHRKGLDAQLAVDSARKNLADALGCDAGCIYFTSGATESNNLALRGACSAYGKRKKRLVVSSVEHASVAETFDHLETTGFEVVRVSPDKNGEFHAEDFIDACDENTCLISMMYVNNETGYILPVSEVFSAVKRRFPEIITHCDCVQAFMKIPLKADSLKADLISVSGHKFHAVKGVGVLYVKKGVRILPIVTGGKQEKGLRSGTESVPLIAALGKTVEKMYPTIKSRYESVSRLKEYLVSLMDKIDGITINSRDNALPYIINISAEGKRSEIMLHFLEQKGIYVSSGSACSKGAQSGVLGEFGINGKLADSAVRVSMTHETTEEELRYFAESLAEGMSKIRT